MGLFGYLWLAFIGLVIGVIAKFLTPGRDPGGCIVTMLIGLVGSVLGGALADALHLSTSGETMWFVMSVIGAIILLLIYRLIIGPRKTP
ncbi:MAG: GlsB/YeaQ/YmgE family stress response membrane protein [Bacteroidota bacterium]|nr:GlsB/YeaQ/YmgE family stress response membrane protein [Bacteroidota bacterium]MDP4234131.1 GlsB/YeaQ/YmgE family stress response membrane protein [Bacteroidota bacterium]MDP4244068.1 GlsB/YeaQ/YmgE family stress response membrane protein [Bacteroidota bacterium]MDP4289222.1 GlsB/YeaQ/YmgE family stress response membrane protein [Bacteroidota bacterium]